MPGKKKKRILICFGMGGLFLLLGVITVTTLFYRYRYAVAVQKEGYLYVPTGANFEEAMDSLISNDFLRNPDRFRTFALARKLDERVKPGRYMLMAGMTYSRLIGLLAVGEQTPVNLTFNNIRTMDRLASVVSRYIEADSVAILAALTSEANAAKYGFNRHTFIGMFVPNTYQFFWNTTPDGFLNRMKKEYDRFWTEEREMKREAIGMSREEIITLASIVREETLMSDEMPRVAGAYMNRLKIGMLLQADPTVKFAVGDFTLRRILFVHLEVDSPYNTYKYAGLPPGPICMPSIKAIDAVLNYEKHNYYYFCAKEDFSGYHNFARTLAEHNQNARRYQEALNRRGIR